MSHKRTFYFYDGSYTLQLTFDSDSDNCQVSAFNGDTRVIEKMTISLTDLAAMREWAPGTVINTTDTVKEHE